MRTREGFTLNNLNKWFIYFGLDCLNAAVVRALVQVAKLKTSFYLSICTLILT